MQDDEDNHTNATTTTATTATTTAVVETEEAQTQVIIIIISRTLLNSTMECSPSSASCMYGRVCVVYYIIIIYRLSL